MLPADITWFIGELRKMRAQDDPADEGPADPWEDMREEQDEKTVLRNIAEGQ